MGGSLKVIQFLIWQAEIDTQHAQGAQVLFPGVLFTVCLYIVAVVSNA